MHCLKPYVKFNKQKRIEAEKNGDKDEKGLYKFMDNEVYNKMMENLRKKLDVRLVSYKKDCSKWTSKPRYMSQKMFDNDLVTKRKSNVLLMLNKPAYVRMCITDLSKVLNIRVPLWLHQK